jgi:hypothetical protein
MDRADTYICQVRKCNIILNIQDWLWSLISTVRHYAEYDRGGYQVRADILDMTGMVILLYPDGNMYNFTLEKYDRSGYYALSGADRDYLHI